MGETYRRTQLILDCCKKTKGPLTKHSIIVQSNELRKTRPHLFHGSRGAPLYTKLNNLDQVRDLRNSMACGNYPLSMTNCEVCGINGDCGLECPVFVIGECHLEDPEEFVSCNSEHFDFGSDDFQEMIENYPCLIEYIYGYNLTTTEK